MSNPYNELLEAAISELENRQRNGQRYVSVSNDLLKELSSMRPTSKAVAAPSPAATQRPSLPQMTSTPAAARVGAAAAPPVAQRKPEPDIVISTDAGKAAAIAE